MALELILQKRADGATVQSRRGELSVLRHLLAEREEALSLLRTQLKTFESRYFRQVGVLYAQLDDIEARITEREVDLYDSDAARVRAEEARQRAQQSHEAAYVEEKAAAEFDPPPSLKTLFREVARRIHPDLARDNDEAQYFTLLMARANGAYRRGDSTALQRLLEDHADSSDEDGESAELAYLTRQIQHARRDIAALDVERDELMASDIAHLHADAETAARQHRDLLTELAAGLREQIVEAERRFEFIDRQVTAHGR